MSHNLQSEISFTEFYLAAKSQIRINGGNNAHSLDHTWHSNYFV